MRIVEKKYKKTEFSPSDRLRIPGYLMILVGLLMGIFIVVFDTISPGNGNAAAESQLSIFGVSGSARWIFSLALILFGWVVSSAPTVQDWIDIRKSFK